MMDKIQTVMLISTSALLLYLSLSDRITLEPNPGPNRSSVWSELVLDDGAFGEGEGYVVPADGVRILQEVILNGMALPKQSCYLLQDGERITRLRNRGVYSTSFTPGLVLPPGSRYVARCPHGNKLLINYPTFILSGTLHQ